MDTLIPLIAGLPLAGFVVTALIGRRLGKQAHWIPVLAVAASWAIAMVVVVTALTGGFADGVACEPGSQVLNPHNPGTAATASAQPDAVRLMTHSSRP